MVSSLYARGVRGGFGKRDAAPHKPLKRPSQARAKFTVQAIYDAFVRIWQRDGWPGVTTRAVALETGIAVGTLYDYFPNKHALLSGYVRHGVDALLEAIEREAVQPVGLDWRERVHRLVQLSCGIAEPPLPCFDAGMLLLEAQIAEPKHHHRVFDELSAQWLRTLQACTDLPEPPSPDAVRSLFILAWGGRRYRLLLEPHAPALRAWAAEVERICCLALDTAPPPSE